MLDAYNAFCLCFISNKVPNSSPTAASASSDMYGAAVLDACEQIKARMEPIASQRTFNSFSEVERYAIIFVKCCPLKVFLLVRMIGIKFVNTSIIL